MLIVTLQQQTNLLNNSLTDRTIGGNTDFVNGGGMGSDTESSTKEETVWDLEW